MTFFVTVYYILGFIMATTLALSLFFNNNKFKINKESIGSYITWSIIGLLSSQWLFFVLHLACNAILYKLIGNKKTDIDVYDKNKEKIDGKNLNTKMKIYKFINLIFIGFIVLNYFHLHLNLTQIILGIF